MWDRQCSCPTDRGLINIPYLELVRNELPVPTGSPLAARTVLLKQCQRLDGSHGVEMSVVIYRCHASTMLILNLTGPRLSCFPRL